jgi:hypothetical protein
MAQESQNVPFQDHHFDSPLLDASWAFERLREFHLAQPRCGWPGIHRSRFAAVRLPAAGASDAAASDGGEGPVNKGIPALWVRKIPSGPFLKERL